MEKYIAAALALILLIREGWNAYQKRKLKKENNDLRINHELEKIGEQDKKTKTAKRNYHDLRDKYGRFTSSD